MRFLLAILLFPFLLPAAGQEPETPVKTDPPLQIRLVSENSAIAPGKPFRLGLHLIHAPGTHTYWKHPGIVGLPTTIRWELPPGFTAGEIQWPAPQVVKMGNHNAQGYEGETLLVVPITPPPVLSVSSATLSAKVSWMCCGKSCSPANDVPFTITLPVSDTPRLDSSVAPLFGQFRSKIPGPPKDWKSITTTRAEDEITLTLMPRESITSLELSGLRFFTADGQVDSDGDQRTRVSPEGVVVITLPRSKAGPAGPAEPATLPGVLVVPGGKPPSSVEISPAY